MLATDVILKFCEKTNFFGGKPNRNCLVEAMKLEVCFGHFIKRSLMSNQKFTSAEEFIKLYQQSCGAS